MSRTAIGRTVVRLYPNDIREKMGEELVGTLLDAGQASRGAYICQLASLIRSGLAARARVELSQPPARIAVTTLCWIAVLSAMSELVQNIGLDLRWGASVGSSTETLLAGYILPALILALFTLRRNRTTGILGLAWLAIFVHQHPMLPFSVFLQTVPLQAAGFTLLAIRPRGPLPAGRFLWLVPAGTWLLYQLTLLGQHSGVGKIAPVLSVLLLLPWAPSLALGTAMTWALSAIYYLDLYQSVPFQPHLLVYGIELLAGVPLLLMAAWATRRVATRSG